MGTHDKKGRWVFYALIVAGLIGMAAVKSVINSDERAKHLALTTADEQIERLIKSKGRLGQELSDTGGGSEHLQILSVEDLSRGTALIRAELSGHVQNADISLHALSPVRPRTEIPVETVAFRLEAEAPLDHLVSLLQVIEFGVPIMFIERASIRRLQRPADQQQPEVSFQIDVVVPVEVTGADE